jgi:hypothetical protein
VTGRRRALVAAVAALSAGTAAGQDAPVRVRGGEHPSHSRLVIDAPRGAAAPAWGVEGRTLTLLLPGLTRPLAPATGRLSRVAGVTAATSPEGARLTVALSCDCGARVERLSDGRVIVDVSPGAPRPAPPAAVAAAAPSAPTPGPPAATPADAAAAPALAAADAAPPRPTPRPPRAAKAAADAPPAAAEPAPAAMAAAPPAPQPPAQQPPAQQPPAQQPPAPAPAAPPAAAAATAPAPQTAPPSTGNAAAAAPAAAVAPPAGGQPSDATIEAARSALLSQLTRAAEEGFLTLAEQPEPEPTPSDDGTGADAAPRADAPAAPAPNPDPDEAAAQAAALDALSSQMRALTGLDLAQRPEPARRRADGPPAHCAPAGDFDLAAWTDAAPFAEQMGARRNALVGEFDLPDADAVAAYARMLVAHGFGVEARAALAAFADETPPPPMLADIARLVEGEPADDGPLKAGLGCPGAHGLWAAAAVAHDGGLDAASIDLRALTEPLAATPPRARTQLILPIAGAALDAGMVNEAEALAGIAARGEPPPPDGDGLLTVLTARVDAARGDWRRAEATLAPLLSAASPAGVEAMIRMTEFRAAQRVAAPPGLAETMEALAHTLGPSPQGRRLLRAAATARAEGEGLGLAMSSLARLAAEDLDAASAAARDLLVDYDPAPAEGASYAQAVLDHLGLVGDGPESDRARIAAALRLAGLGLENLAETVLAPAIARGSAPARIAAAEAATAALEPDRALAHLQGLTGDRAARARAAAHAAAGDYARAAEAAVETGDAALRSRYAWLAGNWAAAAAAGEADRRILAAWMAGAGAMPDELRAAAAADPALAAQAEAFAAPDSAEGKSLLEAAGDALEASRRRRAVVGGLLTDG